MGSFVPPTYLSELDELQEEVQRRTREEEQQRQEEKQRGVVLGFNPQPSKYLDLDQLQIQGTVLSIVCQRQSFCSTSWCVWSRRVTSTPLCQLSVKQSESTTLAPGTSDR
ncbi:hypothetical protein fugu_012646 [Takifugu bimaculatus]|uniref:Uncharacterized protein n=1 Tax=Takifugu bimaculatus TaxID=433685 RepID=A0A4Z2C612_9TELE|nr:hypothetical protein fugu_012646 [Takifugu bimaculatus]